MFLPDFIESIHVKNAKLLCDDERVYYLSHTYSFFWTAFSVTWCKRKRNPLPNPNLWKHFDACIFNDFIYLYGGKY